jgi:hypothetical protein
MARRTLEFGSALSPAAKIAAAIGKPLAHLR